MSKTGTMEAVPAKYLLLQPLMTGHAPSGLIPKSGDRMY